MCLQQAKQMRAQGQEIRVLSALLQKQQDALHVQESSVPKTRFLELEAFTVLLEMVNTRSAVTFHLPYIPHISHSILGPSHRLLKLMKLSCQPCAFIRLITLTLQTWLVSGLHQPKEGE